MDHEFRVCLKYWLGLHIFEEGAKCTVCHSAADMFGDHHVGCGGNTDRTFRHNSICDVVFSASQTAAMAPRKKVPSLIPGSQSRPADVFLPTWTRGQRAALDITVISFLQQLTLCEASSVAGHALSVGEARKIAVHAASCRASGVSFIPIVFKALGGLSELAVATLSNIGRLLGQRTGVPPSETTHHLFKRCALERKYSPLATPFPPFSPIC